MKLTFELPVSEYDHRSFPHGYWGVVTDDGGYDAVGADPLTAISALAVQLEAELAKAEAAAEAHQ